MVYFSTAAKANTQPRTKSLRRMDIFQLAHISETSFSVFRSLQGRKEFHHMQWYVVILTAVLATGAIREAAWTNILTFCFFYCCLVLEGNCNWRENQLIFVFLLTLEICNGKLKNRLSQTLQSHRMNFGLAVKNSVCYVTSTYVTPKKKWKANSSCKSYRQFTIVHNLERNQQWWNRFTHHN